jgi:hypothetical protein
MTTPSPFDQIFAEPVGDTETFPGFLLVNHGKDDLSDKRSLAWAYSEVTFRAIDFALAHTALPHQDATTEAAFPALFLARHTLELYLKGLVPDWNKLRGPAGNAHQLKSLAKHLSERIQGRYDAAHIEILTNFLQHIHDLDPKSTSFRYTDGAQGSFKEPNSFSGGSEFWIDFQALQVSLRHVFGALDRIWAEAGPDGLKQL